MKVKFGRFMVIAAVLANVTACGYVKSLFPDKEKDYQFTTEIPPLILPPDLGKNSVLNMPVAAAVDETAEDVAPADEPAVERKLIQVEMVKANDGSSRLRIGAPKSWAWRMVGKALSRNSIEVTSRNQEEGLLRVQYDPDEQKANEAEGSIENEIAFFRSGFGTSEKEYVFKLTGDKQQTEVMVMDAEQKPLTEGPGLTLLTLLHDTIKADLAK